MVDEPAFIFVVVASVVALLACLVVWRVFYHRYTLVQCFLHGSDVLLVRVMWRAKITGRFPLPPDQGAVIICNHRSSIDPCIIHLAGNRRVIHWMVAQLYGQRTFIGWLMRTLEIIPVERRGSDLSSIKAAIRLAADGGLVGMFPEGAINTSDDFMRAVRPGALLVALKAHVPIVPCYIEGSPYHDVFWKPVFMRARVRMKVGAAIDISEYYGREREEGVLQRLTIDCVKEIAKLAGRDDFEPRLAGRDWKTWQ